MVTICPKCRYHRQAIANCSFGIGTVLIIMTLVWGGLLLKQQRQRLAGREY